MFLPKTFDAYRLGLAQICTELDLPISQYYLEDLDFEGEILVNVFYHYDKYIRQTKFQELYLYSAARKSIVELVDKLNEKTTKSFLDAFNLVASLNV